MPALAPFATRYAPTGMVCSVDHLASEAGVAMLRAGGSAADAAIAANAVLAVTSQHLCGMGGDLFALVHTSDDPTPAARVPSSAAPVWLGRSPTLPAPAGPASTKERSARGFWRSAAASTPPRT